MAWRSVIGGIIAVLMSMMDLQITNAAIGIIQAAFHAPLANTSWISSAYLIAEIVMMPLTGVLTRWLGYRRYAHVFCVMFMVASLMCAHAPTFFILIAARLLQGLAGGALMPLAYNLIMTRLDQSERARAMALFSATVALAPMLGPALGGILAEHFGWASIFYINLPIGLAALALMRSALQDDRPAHSQRPKVDWPGLVAVVIGLGCLQYVLETGNQYGWFAAPRIVLLSSLALIALSVFTIRAYTIKHPLIALRLLANRQLALACSANILTGAVIYGTFFIVPYFLVQVRQFTPADISQVILIGGSVQLALLSCMPRLLRHISAYTLITIGAAASALSAGLWATLTTHFHFMPMLIAQLARGVGFSLMTTPLGVLATTANVRDAPSASILFNIARSLGGAIGVAALTACVGLRYKHNLALSSPGDKHAAFALAFHQTFVTMSAFLIAIMLTFIALEYRAAHERRKTKARATRQPAPALQ